MIRFLVDVYRVDIPLNAELRDDLTEATEDWLKKVGREKCYQFQTQGNSLSEVGSKLLIMARPLSPLDPPPKSQCA